MLCWRCSMSSVTCCAIRDGAVWAAARAHPDVVLALLDEQCHVLRHQRRCGVGEGEGTPGCCAGVAR
jgi:hypothetical protein